MVRDGCGDAAETGVVGAVDGDREGAGDCGSDECRSEVSVSVTSITGADAMF